MIVLLLLFACDSKPTETPAPVPAALEAVVATPAPSATAPRVVSTSATRLAASHILIAYAGAVQALPTISRTREEAKARAEEARTKVLAGADFATIARAYSDDPSASRGGSLGGFDATTMVAPFTDAVRALSIGQIGTVVETPFGFHVIRRDALEEVHIAHLMVGWKGAERAPDSVTRSKEEAKARMAEAQAALAKGEDWAEVVRRFSDGPLADQSGDLGWMGRGQIFEPLDSAAFDLDIGATSAVLESTRGYHLIKRTE